jgi:hypothetical protein
VAYDDLNLTYARRNGKFDVSAEFHGEILHRDLIDPAKSGDRARYADRLCESKPGLDPAVIEDRIKGIGRGADAQQAEREDQVDVLLRLASPAELFRDDCDKSYATVPLENGKESLTLEGSSFREWLFGAFYQETNRPPGKESLDQVISTLIAESRRRSLVNKVWVRVAGISASGPVYLDLVNKPRQVVEVTAAGWHLIDSTDVPVRFVRFKAMNSLPVPVAGGSIEELRPFVNVGHDEESERRWRLLVGTLGMFLNPNGPYPLLAICGEQGSAKSTMAKVVRFLVDPNAIPLRSLPRNEHELMISATHAHCLAFDNLSSLSPVMSDAFCRIATEGGFSVRSHYENEEETLFKAMKPIVLNGIEDLATRSDLLSRAVILHLPSIEDGGRMEEREFWSKLEAARPRILGALLDGLAGAIRVHSSVRLSRLPRMADFARWAEAFGQAVGWPAGTFLEAYAGNRVEASELAVESCPVAATVRALMSDRVEWEGTVSELLYTLGAKAGESVTRGRSWPARPNVLSGKLRRAAPGLRQLGITIDKKRTNRAVVLVIKGQPGDACGRSTPPTRETQEVSPRNASVDV